MVRYSGEINNKNEYDPFYYSRNININPLIKDYEHHLKLLYDDIINEEKLERERNDRRTTLYNWLFSILCAFICIIIIALGIIFPKFGMVELEILLEILGGWPSG